MDTINTIELGDESIYPDHDVLRKVLGSSFPAYESLLALFDGLDLIPEWRYYHDGKSWLCKVQKGKRTIVWMSAWDGYMQVAAYIPLRLLEQIMALPISEENKQRISETKNVGKSKPCIFEVRNTEIFQDLETVIQFKIKAK